MASRAVGPKGRVVGVDLAACEPFDADNLTALEGDLESPDTAASILDALGDGPADLVLCDAAPKLTGVRERDRAAEERLLEAVEALLPALLRPGGDLLVKILDGPEAQAVSRRIGSRFAKAKTVKSQATRKGSSERYLLARDHRPPVD